ncbi:MAG: Crp/Fnr family transcriptional regulator [Burkholderiales bacterium]
MKEYLELFEFYEKMDEADKALLKNAVLKKELSQGQIMTGDNSQCNGVPMVAKGRLRLFRISDKGREMTLYRINEGQMCLLAAVCAMGDTQYDFSIEAEKSSTLLIIPPEIFGRLFARSQPFRTYMFNELAKRLITSVETIEMLVFSSIEERILEYLRQKAGKTGEVKVTHEKMAVDLGSSREVITRQLKKMSEKGLLRLGRGKIILN